MAIRTGRETLSQSAELEKTPALTLSSPLKSIEEIIDMLRRDRVPSADVQTLMKILLENLRQRFDSSANQALFDDTVQYAPWLTAETERLKKQQSDLMQSLTSCCLQVRSLNFSEEANHRLLEQLSDFAESYVECETEQERIFHKAFPGPDWTG